MSCGRVRVPRETSRYSRASRWSQLERIGTTLPRSTGLEEPVTARPVEPRLQHHSLRRVDLRLVDIARGFGHPENIGHPVIADPVARPEVIVRGIIERAPADAARVAIVACQLIVDAGKACRSACSPTRIPRYRSAWWNRCATDKFRIQITRMIRRAQREAEVIDGEDVFE